MTALNDSGVQQTFDEFVSELWQELERLKDGIGRLESNGAAG